ncbi:MAG: hypothetical protein BWZ10_03346 [candidate division BRC1 bacterium ADurb.BinA364]|nr:MAG: hypothetical protein BWZ10_03346 [candidate division BRC1 bacterium ADurb.BinA364]
MALDGLVGGHGGDLPVRGRRGGGDRIGGGLVRRPQNRDAPNRAGGACLRSLVCLCLALFRLSHSPQRRRQANDSLRAVFRCAGGPVESAWLGSFWRNGSFAGRRRRGWPGAGMAAILAGSGVDCRLFAGIGNVGSECRIVSLVRASVADRDLGSGDIGFGRAAARSGKAAGKSGQGAFWPGAETSFRAAGRRLAGGDRRSIERILAPALAAVSAGVHGQGASVSGRSAGPREPSRARPDGFCRRGWGRGLCAAARPDSG